jgi:hypothetical protein
MNDNAAVCGIILMLICYCVPMLKRMDELEERMFDLENEIRSIKKALYIVPEQEDKE